jgi:predicted AAA+ superfamily ATPase
MQNISILQRFNPQWATGKVSEDLAKPFRRSHFFRVTEELKRRQIIVLTGLRRVGKSTIMFQIMEKLLSDDIAPRSIFYYSFDDEKSNLEEVLESFEKNVLMKPFATIDEKIYVLLDEIQYSKGWEGKLKSFYDLYPKIKFIVSGSASLIINKSVREKLAGRFYSVQVDPLDFKEFLAMKKLDIGHVEFKFEKLKETYLRQTMVLPFFLDYVRKGGFPELTEEDSEMLIAEYIRNSITDRVIFRDLAFLIEKRDVDLFEKIIRLVCVNPGMLTNYVSISQNLNRDRRTISNYFQILRYAMLLTQTTNYRKGAASVRKLPKTYTSSTGIEFALNPPGFNQRETFARIIENLVVISCRAEYYWRKGQNEVDIILVHGGTPFPIEVKYSNKIDKKDLRSLLNFMKENEADFGVIVSEEDLREIKLEGKSIWIVPAWLLILTLPLRHPLN